MGNLGKVLAQAGLIGKHPKIGPTAAERKAKQKPKKAKTQPKTQPQPPRKVRPTLPTEEPTFIDLDEEVAVVVEEKSSRRKKIIHNVPPPPEGTVAISREETMQRALKESCERFYNLPVEVQAEILEDAGFGPSRDN